MTSQATLRHLVALLNDGQRLEALKLIDAWIKRDAAPAAVDPDDDVAALRATIADLRIALGNSEELYQRALDTVVELRAKLANANAKLKSIADERETLERTITAGTLRGLLSGVVAMASLEDSHRVIEVLRAALKADTAQIAELRSQPSWLSDAAEALGQVRSEDGAPLALNWTQVLEAIRDLRADVVSYERQAEQDEATAGLLCEVAEAAQVFFDAAYYRDHDPADHNLLGAALEALRKARGTK